MPESLTMFDTSVGTFPTSKEFKQVAHASNAEMFVRMGERLGIEVTAEILDDTWLELIVAGWVLIDDETGGDFQ